MKFRSWSALHTNSTASCQEMVPLASAVGKDIGLFVVARIIPRNGSELQDLHAVSSRHQPIHPVLLQLQNDLRIPVRFAQTQKRFDSVVAGHANPETTVHDVVAFYQHNLPGGHPTTSDQHGRITVTEQAGNQQSVVVTHEATAGAGVGNCHHHPVIGDDDLLMNPSGQRVGRDKVQGVGTDLIQQVAGFLYHGGALLLIPTTGGGDKSAEVVKAGGVQQVVGFGSVDPIERTVPESCFVFDADRGLSRHSVRFVLGAAQVGDGLSEQVGSIQQSDGVVLIGDAFVVNRSVGLKSHN